MRRENLVSILTILAVVAAAGVLDAGENCEQGWKFLFDGKSLDGWEKHGGKAEYSVKDGEIVGQTVPNSRNTFLCTKQRFGDFELIFEVKVDNALNSGVQIRSNIADKLWGEPDRIHGPQVEIEASPGDAGYIYSEATGRNWLNSDRRKNRDAFKNGKWNQFRVLCRGPNIKTWVNGKPIADLTDEKSSREGLIGLQVHGVEDLAEPLYIHWRKIKIRKLQ